MKKIISLTLAVLMLFSFCYVGFEPEITYGGTGQSPQSDLVAVSVVVAADISISSPADVTLTGSIYGVAGGAASSTLAGGTTWTVTTTNANGYYLTIQKSQLLLTDGGGAGKQFADYVTSTAPVDSDWSDPGDTITTFGMYVVGGDDIVQAFLQGAGGDGTCNTVAGAPADNGHCFSPVPTAGGQTLIVANRATPTGVTGSTTTVKFKAAAGTNNNLQTGTYTTNVGATAVVNL